MTVVAWDGKTLAADKRASYGGMICTVTKIFRVGDLLVGGAGELPFVLAMVEWVRNGRKVDEFPADQRGKDDWQPLLVIEPGGAPLLYERTPCPVRYEQPCIAIGSGREYACAAMHCGKSAREAVDVAIALDSACGNGIDTLELQMNGEVIV
jgi:20S proteasome alpha/beta subunit